MRTPEGEGDGEMSSGDNDQERIIKRPGNPFRYKKATSAFEALPRTVIDKYANNNPRQKH